MSDNDDTGAGSGRLRKILLIVVALIVTVYVLFTWVFPYITELGLSPALD